MRLSPKMLAGCIAVGLGLCATAPIAKADFTVTLDQNWNNGGGGGGTINGTPPTLKFEDVGGYVKLTITNSLTVGSSPSIIDNLFLNLGDSSVSTSLLNGLVFTELSGPVGMNTAVTLDKDKVKADGTGGFYDIQLDFTPQGSQLA